MQNSQLRTNASQRIYFIYILIFIVSLVFIFRLFQLQIIRHSYYLDQAQASQLKRYEVPAERGAIYAMDGNELVPLVLNETKYRIVTDPRIVPEERRDKIASTIADILKIKKDEVLKKFELDSRYEILATKQPKEIRDKISELMMSGDLISIFSERTVHRVYPGGVVAAQILGFVNDEGEGVNGVEQALNDKLKGTPGRIAALTDPNGVPLLASSDENIVVEPVDGKDVVLSIEIAMQRQLENNLKTGLDNAKSESGSAVIIEPETGFVKAMANYPSYDPAKFAEVTDTNLYNNAAVSSVLEPGSIMKVLTTAAALDQGVVSVNSPYYDSGYYQVDGATITNVAEVSGSFSRTVADILRLSLNTGATYLLQEMGGGEINEAGRVAWHRYMTEKYGLGSKTGIEQGFEEAGYIPSPTEGYGLNIQYANTTFGQGMTATPLQLISALSSVINGGTYYQPTLVAGTTTDDEGFIKFEPEVVRSNVIKPEVSSHIVDTMNQVVALNNRPALRSGYIVGGKTGTAQIARPEGGYYDDRFNGTYAGFVGGDKPQYAVIIRVNEPKIAGYAGSKAAGPIFATVIQMLIDNFGTRPRSP